MKFLTFAAIAGLAAAACPNACSGKGTCDKNDICSCYAGYEGADCSLRKCEVDRAWATNAANPHAYAECSGQGVCNRQTGECECFDGFTGRACARSACPNDCSGNGQCKLLSEVKTAVAYSASNWDAKRIQTCVCDPGFFGSDCSQRLCPTGDDPLTLCKSGVKKQYQEVRFALGSAVNFNVKTNQAITVAANGAENDDMAIFGALDGSGDYSATNALLDAQLRISYVDSWGGKWTASGVDVFGTDDNTAKSMKLALENLPNKKVHDVTVTSAYQYVESVKYDDGTATLTKSTPWVTDTNKKNERIPMRAWLVQFQNDETNSNNVGLQNSLVCDSGYSCTEAGCQPVVKMPFLYRYASTEAKNLGTDLNAITATSTISFFRGPTDLNADFTHATDKKFIRLNPASQPQMPAGYSVDDFAVNPQTSNHVESFKRYDIRVLIAVVDGGFADGSDGTTDLYYTKVIFGHQNIAKTNSEGVGYVGSDPAKVWTSSTGTYKLALEGFTFQGEIPAGKTNVPIPGAPGVFVDFPHVNIVAANEGRIYEIVMKLPSCSVTPVTKAQQVFDLPRTAAIVPVDSEVENIECSGRGSCDRKSGKCSCYDGYYGIACSRQTVIF